MTQDERAKIVAKIKALLAKTQSNGCTEAEAASAAAMAAKMMTEYDVSMDTVEAVEQDRYGARKRQFAGGSGRRTSYHEVNNLVSAIAKYFDCRVWIDSHGCLVFFGSADETEMAHEMVKMMRVAMETEWKNNRDLVSNQSPGIHGRALRASFMHGMTRRLNERFAELRAERTAIANQRATGNQLIVLKGQLIQTKYNQYARDNNLRLKTRTSTRTISNSYAFDAGKLSGNKININQKLN